MARLVAFARREPGKALAILLGTHFVVWTLLPWAICPNLQLDLVEDLALGKEWQLGYWKHPPLPWWLADLLYRITGDIHAVYLLGPLTAVLCLYGVWLLGRELVGGFQALIAVLILEGIHFYSFSAVKFAHDQMQLPFWAFTGLFLYRAILHGRLTDWALAGLMLAGAFWSKYAAFVLIGTVGLMLLFEPRARASLRTPGPWLMALVFAIVVAPNVWWLFANDFLPFAYVERRAVAAPGLARYLVNQGKWFGGQLLFVAPAILLTAVLYLGARRPVLAALPADRKAAFDRRFIAALALGPFVLTTLIAAALGRLPIAMWGYPLWSFAPLAAIVWLWPVADGKRLQWFFGGALAAFVAFPVAYAGIELLEPLYRDRAKATQYPGDVAAQAITRAWRERYGKPLLYVGGTEFAANNLAVYSEDKPHVIVHGNLAISPWIDPQHLRRYGAVFVWEDTLPAANIGQWQKDFPGFEIQPKLILAKQTWRPVNPARVVYAFVPPRE